MSHLISLDPTKINDTPLSAVEMSALHEFLEQEHINEMWHMNHQYQYNYQNTHYIFCFSQNLLRRQRKMGKTGQRFEIFNSSTVPLGQGGYATVYPILGTIKFD